MEFLRVDFYLRGVHLSYFPGSMLIWVPMLIILGDFSRVYGYLTLFYMRGGTLCPHMLAIHHESSVEAPIELIFHDFVPFNICYVPLRPFFKKKFWKFEKSKKCFSTVPTSKGPPFEKKILKIIFFQFFCNKSYFFYLNLNFTCS